MSGTTTAVDHRVADWATRRLTRRTRGLRRLAWRAGYGACVRLWCRPLRVRGLEREVRARLADGPPLVVVANHASHADTALLSLLLGGPARGRLVPAAAEDHFFRPRWLGALVAVLVGALPFPRRGRTGIDRCRRALSDGDHVLLYPQGTRDGGPFLTGVGALARDGAQILPVHLDGTRSVLPKGRLLPRRAPVTVTVGRPLELTGIAPREAVRVVEQTVRGLAPHAHPDRRTPS